MADKMKFQDLGSKPMGMEVPASPGKEKYYPSVHLDLSDFPDLKTAGIDAEVEMVFKGRIKSLHADEHKSEVCLELTGAVIENIEAASGMKKAEKKTEKNKADEVYETISSRASDRMG